MENHLFIAEKLLASISSFSKSRGSQTAFDEIEIHLNSFISLSSRYYGLHAADDKYELHQMVRSRNAVGLKEMIELKKEWWLYNRDKLKLEMFLVNGG